MLIFNDTLDTFYLWLYGIGHTVMGHSDSERRNPLPPLGGLLFLFKNKKKQKKDIFRKAAGFFSLSDWSFTICPTPYNRK